MCGKALGKVRSLQVGRGIRASGPLLAQLRDVSQDFTFGTVLGRRRDVGTSSSTHGRFTGTELFQRASRQDLVGWSPGGHRVATFLPVPNLRSREKRLRPGGTAHGNSTQRARATWATVEVSSNGNRQVNQSSYAPNHLTSSLAPERPSPFASTEMHESGDTRGSTGRYMAGHDCLRFPCLEYRDLLGRRA